jgi:hypothetical protein
MVSPAHHADILLVVTHQASPPALGFQLAVQDARLGLDVASPLRRDLAREPSEQLRSLYEEIVSWGHTSKWPKTSSADRLRSIGWTFSQELLPDGLGARLRDLRNRHADADPPTLCIVSGETLFPWELVCLPTANGAPGPFLAEAFALTRWVFGSQMVLELPLAELTIVVPGEPDLRKGLVDERDFLLGLSQEGERDVRQVPPTVEEVKAAIGAGSFDALHFCGHGSTSARGPAFFHIRLEDDQLDLLDLKHFGRPLGPRRPLIFLNGCETAQGAPSVGRIDGLARTFLDLGAGAFVGTYWSVKSRLAGAFAQHLYSALLAGRPFGLALHDARIALREIDPQDSSWLAYTAYAHPQAVVARSDRASLGAASPGELVLPALRWEAHRDPPGALLQAEYAAVPFHGREAEIDELSTWCEAPEPLSVRLYTGGGGLGKTRLALEICRLQRGRGWGTGFLVATSSDDEAGGKAAQSLADRAAPLLVVIDYAERRRRDIVLLLEALERAQRRPLRVMLLARSALDWWDDLRTQRGPVGNLVGDPARTHYRPLRALAPSVEERHHSFRLAASAMAERLGRRPPEEVPEGLGAKEYESVLLLHMRALASIEEVQVEGRRGVLDFVLDRERRRWRELAEARRLPHELVRSIGRGLALATLSRGFSGETEAVDRLRRLHLLSDQPRAVVAAVAHLLHEQYAGERWIDPLLPDLLGEHLVFQEIDRGGSELLTLTLGVEDDAG